MQNPAAEPKLPTRIGLLLRVGLFAFIEVACLVVFGFFLSGLGLVPAAIGSVFLSALLTNSFALRVWERGSLVDIGLGWSAHSLRNLGVGIGFGALAAVLVTIPPVLFGLARFQKDPQWNFSPGALLFTVVILLFGAFGEELLFRGYGFQLLLKPVGEFATILPISVLFAVMHSGNEHATRLALFNTFLWGAFLGAAFLRSRDLWLPIGLHYGWNVSLPLLGVNLSGFTMKVTGYSLEWNVEEVWSGGGYGPEGGLPATVIVILLFVALQRFPVHRQTAGIYQPDEEV